jgi:tetratricopeptide (TPR) repeat protein
MNRSLCGPPGLSVLLLSLAWLGTGVALADTPPSRWDRAKDTVTAEAWDRHVKVSEIMAIASLSSRSEPERDRLLDGVRDVLEGAHAEGSPDFALRFDLGEVYEGLEHHGKAIQVLEAALAEADEKDPGAERAWNAIAIAYAKTDDSRREIRAYDRILALTLSVGERARILSNRAEAEMRLGQLDEAVEGYQDALAVTETSSGSPRLFMDDVLAHWGLTVALDRSGDATGSEREAALTVSQGGLEIIRREEVFYVPDYEIFYYLGLGRMALAKMAGSAGHSVVIWGAAEAAWTSYVTGAERAQVDCETKHPCDDGVTGTECERTRRASCPGDPWLRLARAHLERAHRERGRAEKALSGSPRAGARIPTE